MTSPPLILFSLGPETTPHENPHKQNRYKRATRALVPTSLIISLTLVTATQLLLAQGEVHIDDSLPPHSVEMKVGEPPATSTPWQLPKPGDPLYDAKKEAEMNKNPKSQWAHIFERGVFKGYGRVTSGPPPANKLDSLFTPNPNLPADAVELSSSEHGNKSDYFQARPNKRPPNVPDDCILVRVFQGKTFLGWTWMPKKGVALLHQPKKT